MLDEEPQIDLRQYPVLVVDDEEAIVKTFKLNYARDFAILGTSSPDEALRIVEEESVAVLVTDQRMPEMQGTDLIQRALERRPGLVPIILTGYSDVEALVKAVNLRRVYRYVPKPWDRDELRETIARAIETFHVVRQNAALVQENARLVTGRIELKRGNLSVSLPSCAGHIARVSALEERPYLTEYHSELAPQTWMPSPQMELVRDGWRADLAPYGGALACEAWTARSEPPLEVPRADAQLGKLQVLRRTLWTESARITRKEAARGLFSAEPSGPGVLTIAFDTP